MADILRTHPSSPVSAELDHYVENELPLPSVVGSLGVILGAVALGSAALATRRNPRLSVVEKCTVAWFCICMGYSLLRLSHGRPAPVGRIAD